MVSLNAGSTNDNNNCPETGTSDGVIYVSPSIMEEITYMLCQNTWFIKFARDAYKKLSDENRDLFNLYVDDRLLERIIPEELL